MPPNSGSYPKLFGGFFLLSELDLRENFPKSQRAEPSGNLPEPSKSKVCELTCNGGGKLPPPESDEESNGSGKLPEPSKGKTRDKAEAGKEATQFGGNRGDKLPPRESDEESNGGDNLSQPLKGKTRDKAEA